MKTKVECIPCMVQQGINCMRFAKMPDTVIHRIACALMDDIKSYDLDETPAYNSSLAFHCVYRLLENKDPYREVKGQSNQEAMAFLTELNALYEKSDNRLFTAFTIAVAGNIIDLGIKNDYNIEQEIALSFGSGFARNDYDIFTKKMTNASDILILSDNSGEIVFDTILVRELLRAGKSVTYMVKGGPISNDAMLEDAAFAGIDQMCTVITTGSNYMGFCRDAVAPAAVTAFDEADLIISKGQANFETLEGNPHAAGKTFCVLKAKCDIVAQAAGVQLGELVFAAL